jgi:hypothetical protein
MNRHAVSALCLLVIALGGYWYWSRLDGLSDLGGFESARQEARERRLAKAQYPGSPASSGNWWEHSGTLAQFLEEFERQLPGALDEAASMRAEHADIATRDRAELGRAMASFAEASVPSAILSEHEMQGLAYDAMSLSTSTLRSKLSECNSWLIDGAKLDQLPKLDFLSRMPEDQPVEFILSRMADRSVTELDAQTAQDVSRLRNDFVREFAILEGRIWEMRPAASFAMKELGLPNGFEAGLAMPPILEFVPELASVVAQQQALRDRYLAQLEIYAAQL